jgi:uncharacterized lipoprotein YajG
MKPFWDWDTKATIKLMFIILAAIMFIAACQVFDHVTYGV